MPTGMCISEDDGTLFVADLSQYRVLMFGTGDAADGYGVVPTRSDAFCFDFDPVGVCANADVIVCVGEGYFPPLRVCRTQPCLRPTPVPPGHLHVLVINRRDSSLVRSFACTGSADAELGSRMSAQGVCFVDDGRHIAVADAENRRVSLFSVDGDFIRQLGDARLLVPESVACSDSNELVVGDVGLIFVFDVACGDLLMSFGPGQPDTFFQVTVMVSWRFGLKAVVHDGVVYAKVASGPQIITYE